MNVEELICNMKKRPGMYVGCMELEPIFHFINGFTYNNAISGKVDIVEEIFKDEFHEWAREQLETKFNLSLEKEHNYLYYLNKADLNSSSKLKLFFELCDKFFFEIHHKK